MIDVIIPVARGRFSEVSRALQSLECQTRPDLISKVLLIVNPLAASSDIDKPDSTLDLQVIAHPVASTSEARNRGLDLATATYVLFLDSDVELTPNWIEVTYSYMNQNPIFAAVQGIVQPDFSTLVGRSRSWYKRVRFGESKFTAYNQLRIFPLIDTASALYRRSSVGSLRFNPDFKRQEDFEFSNRVFNLGYPFAYLSTVAAKKNCHESPIAYVRKGFLDGFYIRQLEFSLGRTNSKWKDFKRDLSRALGFGILQLTICAYLCSFYFGCFWARLFRLKHLTRLDRNLPSKFLAGFLDHPRYTLNPFSRFIEVDGLLVYNNFFQIKKVQDFGNLELTEESSTRLKDFFVRREATDAALEFFLANKILLRK